VIGFFLKANKVQALCAAAAAILLIAVSDWAIGNRASLGLLYIVPMMIGATALTPWQTGVLALLCSVLRSTFDLPSPRLETWLRFVFAFLAYTVSGLFVTALIRNRRLMLQHLSDLRAEQGLRREAEEQLKVLAESSPAAILTISDQGVVLAANRAANALFSIPEGETLRERQIGAFLPVLADALQFENGGPGFRTAAQCQARRANGEVFLAHTWFSSYASPQGTRLAAIVVDSSEEMREREEQGLQLLMRGNRIAAAAVSHEVRNLCSAIALVCSNLAEKQEVRGDEDFHGLTKLVAGLERIASLDLQWRAQEALEQVALQEVLDDLRIVIEPDWREINGVVRWSLPPVLPHVVAERHGLLQAFLNLAQNSHRAVQGCLLRELSITVTTGPQIASVSFQDSGPGVAAPEHLFEPFQPGSDGSGLGLYVSRAVVRSYGGELRFEPQPSGSCFTVEVPVA
jgi:two-component system, LuxR family, sensor kinase FixL